MEDRSEHALRLLMLDECAWLIITDRILFSNARFDLKWAKVEEVALQANRRMESVPGMVTMVKFHRPLGLDVDGFRLENDNNDMRGAFGSLGWIARDSSKPGRRRGIDEDGEEVGMGDADDGDAGGADASECWLLGSSRREAGRLLGRRELKGASKKRVQNAWHQERMVQRIHSE